MASIVHKYNVIESPLVSEKATLLGEKNNQYVFKVNKLADKPMIAKAIEALFQVNVVKVNTLNVKPEKKRNFRGGYRVVKGFKKAYVELAQGQEITFNAE